MTRSVKLVLTVIAFALLPARTVAAQVNAGSILVRPRVIRLGVLYRF